MSGQYVMQVGPSCLLTRNKAQQGTTLSPLWDRDHPLFSREEYIRERQRFVRSKKSLSDQDIEDFTTRQQDYQSRKDEQIWDHMQADLEKVMCTSLQSFARKSDMRELLSPTCLHVHFLHRSACILTCTPALPGAVAVSWSQS